MFRYLAAILAVLVVASHLALAADPKLPPATDPGLVPVALVAHGVDYTDPAIAPRLARDGEGNIVGWDFVDSDNLPYAKDPASNALAKLLLTNPGVELVPVRVGSSDFNGVAGSAGFVALTPVRTVVVTLTSDKKEDWELFAKAAQHFKKLLFVVPAGDAAPSYPAALNLDNVISVTLPIAKDETAGVALAAPPQPATTVEAAVVLAAALVTCHASAIGDGDGKTRKAAILAKLAQPRSSSRVPAASACPISN